MRWHLPLWFFQPLQFFPEVEDWQPSYPAGRNQSPECPSELPLDPRRRTGEGHPEIDRQSDRPISGGKRIRECYKEIKHCSFSERIENEASQRLQKFNNLVFLPLRPDPHPNIQPVQQLRQYLLHYRQKGYPLHQVQDQVVCCHRHNLSQQFCLFRQYHGLEGMPRILWLLETHLRRVLHLSLLWQHLRPVSLLLT